MQQRIVVLAVALLMTPAAAAWGVRGSTEPSTSFDETDGYMPLAAPQSLTQSGQVYFNGWLSASYASHNSLNPNVGSVAGRVGLNTNVAPPITVPWALLGVWMDCNRDGYIGTGDPGLFEYPATKSNGVSVFGVDEGICPVKPVTKFPGSHLEQAEVHTTPRGLTHNDGKWIHEFISLGWNPYATLWNAEDEQNQHYQYYPNIDDNLWDLNDSDARVWMDVGLPDAKATGVSGCWYLGYPRGTLQSTGGIVWAHDCYTNFRVTDALTSLNATLDSTPAGQLTFKDADRNHRDSKSKLNQPNPWGSERDGSFVQPWDCSSPPQNVDDPRTTDKDWLVNVSTPRVPPGGAQANPSAAGTLNETGSGFDECHRSPKNSTGNAPYNQFEGDRLNTAKRVMPTNSMFYSAGFRRQAAPTTVWGAATGGPAPGTPHDFGLRYTGYESCAANLIINCHGGLWRGNQQFLFLEGRLINRNSATLAPVGYQTYYAFVGPTATTTFSLQLTGSVGSYGSENCALPPGEQLFECDPAQWWPGETMVRTRALGPDPNGDPHRCSVGGATNHCRPYGVRPGQAYQFRDIDCTDHSADPLRDEGIHYGVASGTPGCARASR